MKQSQASIKRSIKALRKMMDGGELTDIERRIAYSVETALRWATEDTVGWKRPEKDVLDFAKFLEMDLNRKPRA